MIYRFFSFTLFLIFSLGDLIILLPPGLRGICLRYSTALKPSTYVSKMNYKNSERAGSSGRQAGRHVCGQVHTEELCISGDLHYLHLPGAYPVLTWIHSHMSSVGGISRD